MSVMALLTRIIIILFWQPKYKITFRQMTASSSDSDRWQVRLGLETECICVFQTCIKQCLLHLENNTTKANARLFLAGDFTINSLKPFVQSDFSDSVSKSFRWCAVNLTPDVLVYLYLTLKNIHSCVHTAYIIQ